MSEESVRNVEEKSELSVPTNEKVEASSEQLKTDVDVETAEEQKADVDVETAVEQKPDDSIPKKQKGKGKCSGAVKAGDGKSSGGVKKGEGKSTGGVKKEGKSTGGVKKEGKSTGGEKKEGKSSDGVKKEGKSSDGVKGEENSSDTSDNEGKSSETSDNEKISNTDDSEESGNMDYESLPEVITKRIKALKVLHTKLIEQDAKFYQEVHQLKIKHEAQRQEVLERRKDILSGDYEPVGEECNYSGFPDEWLYKIQIVKDSYPDYDDTSKGIPLFWLTALKNSSTVEEHIQPWDEPILSHLQDIKAKLNESPMGFTLEFHFTENEYFTNKVLTKYYEMTTDPSKLFKLEGPKIINCKGCKIDWKKDKNVTIETETKRLTNSLRRRSSRTVRQTVKRDSFFNFFNPLPVPDKSTLLYRVSKDLIEEDFYLGFHFMENVIPKAVLYYTGETVSDAESEYYDEPAVEEEEKKGKKGLECTII